MKGNIRLQKPVSVTIKKKTLSGTLNKIRNAEIKFDNGINVLALEQGIGKTHRCINYIKEHQSTQRIIYLTGKHDKLKEVEDELTKANIVYKHWYGFNSEGGCPNLNERRENLHKRGFGASLICRGYNYCRSDAGKFCRYREQFKNLPNVVLAPTDYVGTHYVKEFEPQIIFIDETINKFDEFERKGGVQYGAVKQDIQNKIVADIKAGRGINNNWVNNLKSMEFEETFPGHLYDIAWYPLIYHVFDFSKTIPVVLMDATFEKRLFKYLLETYNALQTSEFKPVINVWYFKIKNAPNSTIIVPFPTRGFYKIHFWEHKEPSTSEILNKIRKKIMELAIYPGLITYKGIFELDYIPPFTTGHFGALAGLNTFEDCDVLVVAGTYNYGEDGNMNELQKIFNDPTLGEEEKKKKEEKEKEKKKNKGKHEETNKNYIPPRTKTINGKQYPNFPVLQAENDQWDAIARARPYKAKKYIILLGYIADRYKTKLNYVDNLNLDETLELIEKEFEDRGSNIDMMKAWDLIVDLSKGMSNTEIAKKYKINREGTGGIDTAWVKTAKKKLK